MNVLDDCINKLETMLVRVRNHLLYPEGKEDFALIAILATAELSRLKRKREKLRKRKEFNE